MAVALGTNSGFLETSPTADPYGTAISVDNVGIAVKDTSPATAVKVTEIGWWCNNATEEANFDVALYDHNTGSDKPGNVVCSIEADNAKGTDAGWKKVTGLNITINSSTIYWVGVQLDDTPTATQGDYTTVGSPARDSWEPQETALEDPWYPDSGQYANDTDAIYAVWEGGTPPSTAINIGDSWKTVSGANVLQVNIGDTWKAVAGAQVNIADTWKTIVLS